MFPTEFTPLTIAVLTGAASYVIWLTYRIYMATGKCPKCRHRINRAATVCTCCGCRPHEVSVRNQNSIQRRAHAG